MQHIQAIFCIIALSVCAMIGNAQRSYTSFPGDPMQQRIYVLENGLTVCLSENFQEPNIQCALFVRAGNMHETDSSRSIAFLAARNLISSDYVQLMKAWGANEPQATTSYDWSTIQENIPANRLEQWAKLLRERLEHPAFRLSTADLFHITDEINEARNDDHQRAYAMLRDALYPSHPYGRTFTDSLSEQLDDTTITKLTLFYQQHYTPENIVLCLSGHLQFDNAIDIIDNQLGKLPNTTMPVAPAQALPAMPQMAERRLVGDFHAFVTMGYRLDIPQTSQNHLMLELISKILYNRYCGLIDEHLQSDMMQNGFATTEEQATSALLILAGFPQDEQQMAGVRELLLQSIMNLKTGDFSDNLFTTAKNQLKLEFLLQKNDNTSRVVRMLESFQQSSNCEFPVLTSTQLDHLNKQDVINFANQYLQDNYVLVYKAKGDKVCPDRFLLPRCITKMKHNESERALISQLKTEKTVALPSAVTTSNKPVQGLFTLTLTFPAGELNDLLLPYATSYWQTVGSQQHSAQAITAAWFSQACQYDLYCSDKTTTITLTGIDENFNTALQLLAEQVHYSITDTITFQLMMDNIFQQRQKGKQSFATVANCFRTYCTYGSELIHYQLQEEQLQQLTADDLLNTFRQLWKYQPLIDYSGALTEKQVSKALLKNHLLQKRNTTPPAAKEFHRAVFSTEQLIFLPYRTATAHLFSFICNEPTDTSLSSVAELFTHYFSSNQNSILQQKMCDNVNLHCRMSSAGFFVPKDEKEMMFGQTYASVGLDKITDNMQTLDSLCKHLPADTLLFEDVINSGNLSDYTLDDLIRFCNAHIANRPKCWGIIAPDSILDTLRQLGIPIQQVTIEDVFGY